MMINKKKNVINIIDKNILDKFNEGASISDIKENLVKRTSSFKSNVVRDYPGTSVDEMLLLSEEDWEKIKIARVKYFMFYITHCEKRIIDFKWLSDNRERFIKLSDKQLFHLVKLKELLYSED